MTDSAITVRELTKQYGSASTPAVDSFEVDIPWGRVFCLLGPNGAGKTTLVRILAGILLPDAGKASVCGFDVVVRRRDATRHTGVVFENVQNCYGYLTVSENLRYFGLLNRLRGRTLRDRIGSLLTNLELADRAATPVNHLSHGMRRKLAIAIALLREPRVLFLDEPTNGLDLFAQDRMKVFLREWVREPGRALVLTTHDMALAQDVGEEFALIGSGRVVWRGSRADLDALRLPERELELVCRGPAGAESRICPAAGLDAAVRQAIDDGLTIEAMRVREPDLATAFRRLMR